MEERVENVMMEGWGLLAEIVYVVEKEKWGSLGALHGLWRGSVRGIWVERKARLFLAPSS